MSSKPDNNDKVFNGGALVEWISVRNAALVEADRQNCKYHLVYKPEDVINGAVQEAVFSSVRICEKGQEAEHVDQIIGQQMEAARAAAELKRQRIEALPYGRTNEAQLVKLDKLNAVEDRLADDLAKLEQSRYKTVLDTQAAGARFDTELRQFDADRAKAIGILRRFLGPNPKNLIAKEMAEQLPRAAWKRLTDLYENDAATAAHLANTQNLMNSMVFEKKHGDVSEHMGLLDRLNETLVAAGNGKNEMELVNYLVSALERSKDGAAYKQVLDHMVVTKLNREQILEACRGIEQKAANAEILKGRRTVAGARFGKADVVAGANAAIKSERNPKVRAKRTNRGPKSEVVCVKCCKTGHRGRDCNASVVCGICKKTNHCDRFCWETHPELRPAHLKANAAKAESVIIKDLTKVHGQTATAESDSKGDIHETHDRAESDSHALDVVAALGVSSAGMRPMCVCEGSRDLEQPAISDKLLRDISIALCSECLKGYSCAPRNDKLSALECAAAAVGPLLALWLIIIDSGATRHMLPVREGFIELNDSVNGVVVLGKKSYKIEIEGEGLTRLSCLGRVLLVPALSMGLLSVGQLDKDGYGTDVCDGVCRIYDKRSRRVVLVAHRKKNNLYYLDSRFAKLLTGGAESADEMDQEEEYVPEEMAQPAQEVTDSDWHHLHRTLGHLSHGKMLKGLKNENWMGIDITYEQGKKLTLPFCAECYEGKMKAFPRGDRSEREVAIGEKFGIDYKGKFMIVSIDGYNGFYLVGDYASDFLAAFFVKSKTEGVTLKILDEYVALMRRTLAKPPSVMQSDYDTVLRSKKIAEWLRAKGLKLQLSAPYTHWQNGFIEANMGKIMGAARTLMADGNVPARLWSYAVRCAVFLSNRSPISKSDLTPFELVYGEQVDTSYWVPFWSIGACLVSEEERKGKGPFAKKARRVRMVGYDESVKGGYLVYDIASKTVSSRHDCVWNPEQVKEVLGDEADKDPCDDDLATFEDDIRDAAKEVMGEDGGRISAGDLDAVYDRYAIADGDDPYDFALLVESELLEWMFEAEDESADELVQPVSLKEALASPEAEHWKKALVKEVENFKVRGVFADAPQTGKAMQTKVIVKKSRNPDGSIKYKVRLVAKGFTQIKGVNYNETYAPTISTVVVLMSMALCAIFEFYLAAFDVGAAFLNGKNDYPNFAWLPPEFGGKRVEVKGNFYGEKQAPKLWNDQLNEILAKGGLERCPAHPCLYRYWTSEGDVIFLCVHVDDGLVVSNSPGVITWLEQYMKGCLREVKFERTVKRYIGFDVDYRQEERKIYLTHEAYIGEKWKGFNELVLIPMSPSHNLRTAERVERDLTMLHDTGEFRYIADRARPDILVATGEIATGGDKNPSYLHEKVSLRVKNYLTETKSLPLVLGGVDREIDLFGYSDAAYITQGNCKSRLGGCVFLNAHSGAIRSFSKTDSQVSDPISHSSTEAEIKAMDEWVLEVMHIVDLLSFMMGKRYDKPVRLYVDNQSAITLCTTLKQTHRVQHMNLRIHFIREMILKKFLTIHFVPTDENVADMLTKALGQAPYQRHRRVLMSGHDGKLPSRAGPSNYVEVATPAIIDDVWLMEEPIAGHL